MTQPKTQDEYNKRFAENQKIEGSGLGVTMRVPCPFCAAPDFMVHAWFEVEEAYAKDTTCKECGRGMRCIVTKTESKTGMVFVQTRGDDAPYWVPITRDPATAPRVNLERLEEVPGAVAVASNILDAVLPKKEKS